MRLFGSKYDFSGPAGIEAYLTIQLALREHGIEPMEAEAYIADLIEHANPVNTGNSMP